MSFIKEFIAAVIAGGNSGSGGGAAGTVTSVNGVGPDENGDVIVTQVQSDWNVNVEDSWSYIKNRTHWGPMTDLGTFDASILNDVTYYKDAFCFTYGEYESTPIAHYFSLIYKGGGYDRYYFDVATTNITSGCGNASLLSAGVGIWHGDHISETMPFYIAFNRHETLEPVPEGPPFTMYRYYYDVYVQRPQGGSGSLNISYYKPGLMNRLPLPYIPEEIARKSDVSKLIDAKLGVIENGTY